MNPLSATVDGGQVASLFLVLLRCTGFIVTAPIFGHRATPRPVKAGLAAILAITLAGGAAVAPGAQPILLAAPIELLIGVSMGFTLALGFSAVESASRLLSIQMGLSLGAVFDPVGGEASTPFDPLFAIMAGLLFLLLNLHLAVVGVLADSFTTLPIGGGWPSSLFASVAQLIALSVEIAVRIAMPLALILMLAELAVALISRAIPQVNVFFLGLPLKIMLGIALVALALPNILEGMAGVFRFMISGTAQAAIVAGTVVASPLPSVMP
ncbi:MAG: flagellar biosynthetic protein FliR [Chloroflexota bacterium]